MAIRAECATNSKNNIQNESQEFQNQAHLAVLNIINELHEGGPTVSYGKYKTCSQAMNEYACWYEKQRKNHRVMYFARKFNAQFGEQSLSVLNVDTVCEWVERLIEDGLKYDTVRLHVMTASGLISWLDERNLWRRKNPFSGIMKRYKNRFPVNEPVRSYLSELDLEVLTPVLQKDEYRGARIFIEIAFCTGLRPSEIVGDKEKGHTGLSATRLDYDNLTWNILVTKTQGRPFYRKIAVPRRLCVFIANENITGTLPFTEAELRGQMDRLRAETGLQFTQKTFRKDFAHRMENAGASPDIINLHQGRSQHGVIYEHYLTDAGRAERLCRPFISAMFGEQTEIRRVK